jgi:periplasmic divalent cation tolerance protein
MPKRSAGTIVVVATALPSRKEATAMARRIVASRMAACVQSLPIQSVYRWKGRVESAHEVLLLAKVPASRAKALLGFIRQHHPYEIPEILAIPVKAGLPEYIRWVVAETAG